MNKVGILGGTFDPPHYGHLIIAQEVLTAFELDEVWFMPTNIPPHKEFNGASGEDRIEMVSLAIQSNDKFSIQTIEFEREGPSYTVDSMKALTKMFPEKVFYFIIGGDMVEFLPKWNKIDELLEMVTFIGVKRPGFILETEYPILEVDTPEFGVSSSMIRERIKKNKNIKYLLPNIVKLYIEEKKLYES